MKPQCRYCIHLKTKVLRTTLLPVCDKGELKFKDAEMVNYEAPQFKRSCNKFEGLPGWDSKPKDNSDIRKEEPF